MSDVRKVGVYRDANVLRSAVERAVRFRCGACRHQWREWVEDGERPPEPDCPRCGKNTERLERRVAELEAERSELRRRVERLENLTGSGAGYGVP